MAFVYCNDRWKDSSTNHFPGPCEYALPHPNLLPPTNPPPNRLIKSVINKHSARTDPQLCQQRLQKTCVDIKMIEVNKDKSGSDPKSNGKKGKLYRNRSVECKNAPQKEEPHQAELKIMIKNALHSQSHTSSRNKWGNTRIKEMLNQHRSQVNKTKSKLSKQSRSYLLLQTAKKKEEKGLQNMLVAQRKGHNGNLQHPSLVRCKSPIVKPVSRPISQKQLRLTDNSLKEFQIQPTVVYKSQKYQDHSFANNKITYSSPTCSFGNSKIQDKTISTTGLQQDILQDSMEYISDATPGPGSYNIHTPASKISSKIQQFGVTMERFRPEKYVCPTFIAPNYPQYKVSSNAKQENVGFGRTTKEQPKVTQVHNGAFYDDCNTLQFKSHKIFLKQKGDKVCFDSCKERFPSPPPQNILSEEQQESSVQGQQYETQQLHKPTFVFMSKVNRDLRLNSNTMDVQFSGQNANCIAHKLKKQKEHDEDYDITQPAFMTNSKRFIYKEIQPQEKKEQLLGVKIEQLKKKREIQKKSPQKGLSFAKQMKAGNRQKQNVPSPDRYEKTIAWIKPSYNIKFN